MFNPFNRILHLASCGFTYMELYSSIYSPIVCVANGDETEIDYVITFAIKAQ